MKSVLNLMVSIAAFGFLSACGPSEVVQKTADISNQAADITTLNSPENTIYLDTKYGRVTMVMRPDIAPNHVARIKKLTREKFYDGIKFHRVMVGFMAQTGDPTGTGTGGSKYPDLAAEFSKEPFLRGTVGMARSNDPDSANSQFFICYGSGCRSLQGKYTIVGRVTNGMLAVDKIKKGAPGSGTVSGPDIIKTMRVAADVKK